MTAEGQDKMQDGAGQDRLVTAEEIQSPDPALRPQRLADFVGQGQGRANLETFIGAACLREEPMDHALLHGPPGLGKTTMAQIISSELGVGFRATSGPVIARAGDLGAPPHRGEEAPIRREASAAQADPGRLIEQLGRLRRPVSYEPDL